jgi:superfamily II DNA or RNA helicase
MNVNELKSLCKERRITGFSGKKKADIIMLLSNGDSTTSKNVIATKLSSSVELQLFRTYQAEADNAIYEELHNANKCIVKMFCGTGKSLLMRKMKSAQNKKLVVYVFPSLSLIDQFCADYFTKLGFANPFKISSENNSTTDPTLIQYELQRESNKIICVTYQSYKTLLDNIGSTKIDVCIYDEAHHAVAPTYNELIFERNVCDKQIFFTATPKDDNGIVMCDKENGICGRTVYDYSYLRGLTDGYVNPFEIRVDMYTKNTNRSVYESIARAILVSGNNRVLTFHADVNTDRDTSVINFVNEGEFVCAFMKVLIDEFPEKAGAYTKFKMIVLDASIHMNERRSILDKFDTTLDNEVYIISSCETIGEGIDTKNANMCVFVDPKSSFVKIIQNIGRIVRPQSKPSTVLIPCWVDKTKYIGCDEDKEKCDEVIRSDLNKDGNFNGILNVLSALRQEDEDLYNICLHYPDMYSPQEIMSNLEKHGYKVLDQVGDGELVETMEYLLDKDIDYENYEDCDTNEEMIIRIAEDNDVCVEIHTNSFENQIEKYNIECDSGEIIRLYKEEEDEEGNQVYCPIVKKCGKKRGVQPIKELERKDRIKIDVHTNPDVKILWKLVGDFTKEICSCVLECEIDMVDRWFERFEELKKFIDENERIPKDKTKNHNEKKLGKWVSHQKYNYKEGITKNERCDLWKQFITEYSEYFKSNEEVWNETLEKLKDFVNTNKLLPNTNSKNICERRLGNWIQTQQTQYINKTFCMTQSETHMKWSQFLEDYKDYFKTDEEKWNERLQELKLFIDKNKKKPTQSSKNTYEKKLGNWIESQNTTYKNKSKGMKLSERCNIWSQFLEEYKQYFETDKEKWIKTLQELKQFINKNKKTPRQSGDNRTETEQILGRWLSHQANNYKTKTHCMKDNEIYNHWTNFIEEYKQYIILQDRQWEEMLSELKTFIDVNKRKPSTVSKEPNEKQIGQWLSSNQNEYIKCKQKMKEQSPRRMIWSQFLEEYKQYFKSDKEKWNEKMQELKMFININKKRPSTISKISIECVIGRWCNHQYSNYKKKSDSMKDPEIYAQWTQFLEEYKQYFDNVVVSDEEDPPAETTKPKKSMKLEEPSTKKETPEQKKQRTESELSILHQRYKTLTSQNLQREFQETPELWYKYHAISEENEKSFPEESIPRNRIIQELNKIKTKRTRSVVDMGCGKAQIAAHFANDSRVSFINYDHISSNEIVLVQDISNIPLEDDSIDICILCLAMWGSNCRDYISEAYRILESGGNLYIIEATKHSEAAN